MELCLTYDMRAPAFGAQRNRLLDCALDQVSWADSLGFDVVGLGEQHSAEDGYNTSPLILASAMPACYWALVRPKPFYVQQCEVDSGP